MTRLAASNAETGDWNVEGWARQLAGWGIIRDGSVAAYGVTMAFRALEANKFLAVA